MAAKTNEKMMWEALREGIDEEMEMDPLVGRPALPLELAAREGGVR